jgi:peptide/nickel transport system ATP-binding protein
METSSLSPLLRVEQLELSFDLKARPALDKVDFEIGRGESLALVGESGSGKSLSAFACMGLLPPEAIRLGGRVVLHGDSGDVDLLRLSEADFRPLRQTRLAMVFQEPMSALNPLMKCGDQIAECIVGDREERMERVHQVLREVQLTEALRMADSFPHQLSGGQRQRVMIAIALVRNPELLICDEPTTALDPSVQSEILELLAELRKQRQMSMLFISHDLSLVKRIADRVAVMKRGKVIEHASVDELFYRPQTAYTKALLMCRPRLGGSLKRLPTVEELENSPDFAPRSPAEPERGTLAARMDSVSFSYKVGKPVLDGIQLELYRSEMHGLVGESGSGKTTVGKLLCGLLRAQQGEIRIFSHRPQLKTSSTLRSVQYVFQDPYSSLNPKLTIGSALIEPLLAHRLCDRPSAERKVAEWLIKTGLEPEMAVRYPHEFSGGQRQRIVLARALILEPEIVVFDESVAALDVSIQAKVLNLIKDLQAELGFAGLFISHDLAVVDFLCKQTSVLEAGRIVESGETRNVFTRPKHPYSSRLVRAASA